MGKRRPPYACGQLGNKRQRNNSPTTIVKTIEAYDISTLWDYICLDLDSRGGVVGLYIHSIYTLYVYYA